MEILHTILLGVVKYYWGQTVVILNKGKYFGLFETRLASIEEGSLKIPKITAEYMCKYKESLIGKHFKSLAQVMPFLVYDLVLKEVLEAWTVIRELVVLVWHVEIKDLEVYLANLSATIEALLNVTSQCLPSILITKLKFHFLVHLSAYIHRFGPPLIFSTERYELFNHKKERAIAKEKAVEDKAQKADEKVRKSDERARKAAETGAQEQVVEGSGTTQKQKSRLNIGDEGPKDSGSSSMLSRMDEVNTRKADQPPTFSNIQAGLPGIRSRPVKKARLDDIPIPMGEGTPHTA
uniref:Uncharacterized protein n=1 Tax=Moniliophthora roreri TaxID=221103 RepID=A0A0W0EUV4_MONRR